MREPDELIDALRDIARTPTMFPICSIEDYLYDVKKEAEGENSEG